MKKSLILKILYLFLVLIVIAVSSVFATNAYLSAKDISYGSSNVENALNDLYTLKGNDENYSTNEKVVGKWIDGKSIYRKVINCGNLPNNSSKKVSAEISNFDNLVSLYGIAFSADKNDIKVLPYVHTDKTYDISIDLRDKSNINLMNSYDYSHYTAIIYIEYTKTTNTTTNN